MTSRAARASFLDASALVKLHIQEGGSDAIRNFCAQEPLKYTTPFCFYEALSLLKGVWKGRRKGITLSKEEYLQACSRLTAWYGAMSRQVKDLDFVSPSTFREARAIADRASLDLSDAFQILSVKSGYFSVLTNDSKTVFVTADEELAKAARAEGLRVWNCVTEPPP